MPQLDTATLANIGQGGADIGGSMAKAYQLKDLIDTTQLRQMDMKRQQQEAAEAGQIKTLATQFDLSTPEGQNKFTAKVAMINPRQSIAFQREFQDTRHGQNQLIEDDYKLQSMKLDMVENMIAPLAIASMQKKAAGQSPQEIDAAVLPQIMQTVEQAKKMTLPSGKPAMGEEDLKMISKMVEAGNFGETLPALLQRTKAGREQIQQLFQQQSIGQKVETVKGDPSKFPGTNSNKYYKVEFSPNGKGIVLGEAQPTAAMVNLQQGGPSAPNAAGATRGGVLSAMTEMGASFPPGMRSPKVQRETINAALKAHPDETDAQIAQRIRSGNINITADTSGARAFGTQAAKISVAEEEINQTAPLVLDAAKKVSASNFMPWSKLVNLTDAQIGDQNLRQYKIYITSLMNAYDQLAARGGTDVAKREHTREMLSSADSPKMAQAAIDAILQEVKAASKATESAKQRLRGGPAEQVAPPPPAGAPAAPPSSQSPAGAGAASSIKETASEAEYAALPAGSWYRKPGDSPGTHRVKQ